MGTGPDCDATLGDPLSGVGAYLLGRHGVRAPSATGHGLVIAVCNLRLRPGQWRVIETTELAIA